MIALLDSIKKSGTVATPLKDKAVSDDDSSAAAAGAAADEAEPQNNGTDYTEQEESHKKQKGQRKANKKRAKKQAKAKAAKATDDVEEELEEEDSEEQKQSEAADDDVEDSKPAAIQIDPEGEAKVVDDIKEIDEESETKTDAAEPEEEAGDDEPENELSDSKSLQAPRGNGRAQHAAAQKSPVMAAKAAAAGSKKDVPESLDSDGEETADENGEEEPAGPPVAPPVVRKRHKQTPRKTPASSIKMPRTATAAKSNTKKRVGPATQEEPAVKKPRGRPKKDTTDVAVEPVAKEGRGRPKKDAKPAAKKTMVHVSLADLPYETPTENIGQPWPENWQRKTKPRDNNPNAFDKYWYTPKEKLKLRSLKRVKAFLAALDDHNGDEKATYIAVDGSK